MLTIQDREWFIYETPTGVYASPHYDFPDCKDAEMAFYIIWADIFDERDDDGFRVNWVSPQLGHA